MMMTNKWYLRLKNIRERSLRRSTPQEVNASRPISDIGNFHVQPSAGAQERDDVLHKRLERMWIVFQDGHHCHHIEALAKCGHRLKRVVIQNCDPALPDIVE